MAMTIRPMREFVSLRDAIDKLFADSFIRPAMLFDGETVPFAVDLYETPEAYVLKGALPGVKPEDITIDATPGMVTVRGEYKLIETEAKEETYLRRELRTGIFHRAFELPLSIDPTKVEATFKDGMLKVTLGKAEIVKPKQIKVKIV